MRKKMHGKPYYPHLLCASFYVILWVALLLFGSNKPGKVNSYVFFFRYKSDNLLLLIHKQVLHFFTGDMKWRNCIIVKLNFELGYTVLKTWGSHHVQTGKKINKLRNWRMNTKKNC